MIFPKINAYKDQNFSFPKKEIYIVKLHTNNTHTKFQSNSFTFGCAMVTKPGKGVYVTFFKIHFLAFQIVVRKNKCHFWNPKTELDKMGMFLDNNFDYENLTFLT